MRAPPELIRQLPNVDVLVQQLEDEPETIMARAFPAADRGFRARGIVEVAAAAAVTGPPALGEVETAIESERERWFDAGRRAVRKIHDEGVDADLDPEETIGLEAIVLIEGRPALFIQNGHFFPPPTEWQVLEEVREDVETACRSVGRIELAGHPSYDWVGTGFLVAPSVVMTNRHVAEVFCHMGKRRRWKFKPGMGGHIDYVEELGALESAEFEFRNVIGVHETFDLALFRVRRTSSTGVRPPEPLTIASQPYDMPPGRQVYTVGYPAWDGRRNDPEVMMRIFSNVFNVKRLQPGKIQSVPEAQGLLLHDCSTLGGNSGSCVIDLETNQVIGLHFGGRYLKGNHAVALWQLTEDPLLQQARVHFD